MRDTEGFKIFENMIAKTEHTYAFSTETCVEGMTALIGVIKGMGLDPMNTADFKKGIMALFNVEVVNMPDLDNNRYILAPNHVSDFDAVLLGLFHSKIRIVAKTDWTENPALAKFLGTHYDLYGIDRTSAASLVKLMKDAVSYFNDSEENRHFLVFCQGTISDFNNNGLERIVKVPQVLQGMTGVSIVNVFVEQVSLYETTRIVFDEPMMLVKENDFREVWLERQAVLQNSLNPVARRPKLTVKHANNNKPSEAFF